MIRDTLEQLVRLYQAWDAAAPGSGKAEPAEAWKKRLENFLAESGTASGNQKSE